MRRGRPLAKLALAAVSAGSALLAAEAGLRLLGYGTARHKATGCAFDTGRTRLLDCYPSDPRGYFEVDLREPATLERYRRLGLKRLERIASRAPHCVEVRYNSRGYRGPEPGPPRPGVTRVAVLGDSFTEGQGVREGDAYPAALQALLEAAQPGRWEVLNCGRRAADLPELAAEFEKVLTLQPDLVLYAMVPNDPERDAELAARRQALDDLIQDRNQMRLARRHAALGWSDSRLLGFVRDRLETRRITAESTRFYRDLFGAANRGGWARTQARIRAMDRAMRQRGGRFLLVSWPLLVGLEGRYPFEAAWAELARFCAAAGILRHDLLPALRGRPDASLWVHEVDRHPNERAHRLAAESLAAALAAGGVRSASAR
jgi:lysophospholipase L1-like esterase